MSPVFDIAIEIDDAAWSDRLPHVETLCATVVADVLKRQYPTADAHGSTVEISVLLSSNDHVQMLNREYRGKDKPTNVLSFPQSDPIALAKTPLKDGPPVMLGDIILAYGVVVAEAEDQAKALDHHLSHLLVHGCLHLLGFDHKEDDEADVMEAKEIEILRDFGIANPYED